MWQEQFPIKLQHCINKHPILELFVVQCYGEAHGASPQDDVHFENFPKSF